MRKDDPRRIKARKASALKLDDLRHLARWCDWQYETLWNPERGGELTVGQILACYHAANDADYADMQDWMSEDRDAALAAWDRIRGKQVG